MMTVIASARIVSKVRRRENQISSGKERIDYIIRMKLLREAQFREEKRKLVNFDTPQEGSRLLCWFCIYVYPKNMYIKTVEMSGVFYLRYTERTV